MKILPKIIGSFVVMFYILITVSVVNATISENEARALLQRQFIEQSDKNVSAYMQAINVGMTNEQAVENINMLSDLSPNSNNQVPITGGSWSYVGDAQHRILVFQPSDAFVPVVPENKRNVHYTQRRADGIEEIIDESHGPSAEDYNNAVNNYKQAINNSPLNGTEIGRRLLDNRINHAPDPESRRFADSVDRRVRSMEQAQRYGLFDRIAQIARDNNVDIDTVRGYEANLRIPPGEYDVRISTADGRVYDANGEVTSTSGDGAGSGSGGGSGAGGSSGDSGNSSGGTSGSASSGGTPGSDTGGTVADGGNGTGSGASSNGGGGTATSPGGWRPGDPIVPCGRSDANGEVADMCTVCHLMLGIDNVVTFFVKLIWVAGVLVIVIAGVMYIVSAGNQSMVTMAKTAIKNTLIGVAVVLSAFVIIHFTLKMIARNGTPETGNLQNFGTNSWSFECSSQ